MRPKLQSEMQPEIQPGIQPEVQPEVHVTMYLDPVRDLSGTGKDGQALQLSAGRGKGEEARGSFAAPSRLIHPEFAISFFHDLIHISFAPHLHLIHNDDLMTAGAPAAGRVQSRAAQDLG